MSMSSVRATLCVSALNSGCATQGQLLLEDVKDRPLDGYGTTGQPDGRLLEWPYTGKNALYYGRDAVALSDAEKSMQVQVCTLDPFPHHSNIASLHTCTDRQCCSATMAMPVLRAPLFSHILYMRWRKVPCSTSVVLGLSLHDTNDDRHVQGPPKAINRTGTRFTPAAAPGAETPSTTDDSPSISSMPGSEALGQEYSILATPSFTPGVEDSPFITWGDIQGTPLRLDPEDDIDVDPAGASGPHFSIAEVRSNISHYFNFGR